MLAFERLDLHWWVEKPELVCKMKNIWTRYSLLYTSAQYDLQLYFWIMGGLSPTREAPQEIALRQVWGCSAVPALAPCTWRFPNGQKGCLYVCHGGNPLDSSWDCLKNYCQIICRNETGRSIEGSWKKEVLLGVWSLSKIFPHVILGSFSLLLTCSFLDLLSRFCKAAMWQCLLLKVLYCVDQWTGSLLLHSFVRTNESMQISYVCMCVVNLEKVYTHTFNTHTYLSHSLCFWKVGRNWTLLAGENSQTQVSMDRN